jgi:hypothetical protein
MLLFKFMLITLKLRKKKLLMHFLLENVKVSFLLLLSKNNALLLLLECLQVRKIFTTTSTSPLEKIPLAMVSVYLAAINFNKVVLVNKLTSTVEKVLMSCYQAFLFVIIKTYKIKHSFYILL